MAKSVPKLSRLRVERLARAISSKCAAEEVSINPGDYRAVETLKAVPSRRVAQELCARYRLPESVLFAPFRA